jgi:hypothetical protein
LFIIRSVNRIAALALLAFLGNSAAAQFSPKPADAVIPVVGSVHGQAGSNFKTELQMANPSGDEISGFLYLRPAGLARRYEIPAHGTLSFDDVVAEMGSTGLGSLDILADGGIVPTIVARAYDDQPGGTTGVTVPAVPIGDILIRNEVGALIVPRDLGGRYRFNIGIRTMDAGATVVLIVRGAAGTQRHSRTLELEAHQFFQQPGETFAGTTLQSGDSIEVRLNAGSAIVYGTTVDNTTNDSSMQVVTR